MERNWTSESPSEMARIGSEILDFCENRKIFAIFGDLGAGKTLLVKAFLQALGSGDIVTSPTFSIVNTYSSPAGPVYHFDLYRLKRESELGGIGFDEYLEAGRFCFIEWPELAEAFLPDDTVRIEIRHSDSGEHREIRVSFNA